MTYSHQLKLGVSDKETQKQKMEDRERCGCGCFLSCESVCNEEGYDYEEVCNNPSCKEMVQDEFSGWSKQDFYNLCDFEESTQEVPK